MDKYDSNVTHLREYTKSIAHLRGEVTNRVHEVEIQMRRGWNRMKEAKAEKDRERMRAELKETIDKFERQSKDKDEQFAREGQRLRDEAIKQSERTEAIFRQQIQEQNRLNAKQEEQWHARIREMEESHKRTEADFMRLLNERPSGGCLLL
jgi:hypothetical protein